MTRTRSRFVYAITFVVGLAGCPTVLWAQGVEVTPFGGYRFGGDFFELITQQPVDTDGAPSFGVVVDVPLYSGLQVEALFTHQEADLTLPAGPIGPPTRWQVSVDHWQAGGLQEFDDGRARPFAVGTLGLTRYATEGDSEIRFTLGAGGGVKLFPSSAIGVRLNGQVFATFVYGDARVFACSSQACFIGFNTDIVWQMEFTAGLVVRIR